jgi:hypothetical protein
MGPSRPPRPGTRSMIQPVGFRGGHSPSGPSIALPPGVDGRFVPAIEVKPLFRPCLCRSQTREKERLRRPSRYPREVHGPADGGVAHASADRAMFVLEDTVTEYLPLAEDSPGSIAIDRDDLDNVNPSLPDVLGGEEDGRMLLAVRGDLCCRVGHQVPGRAVVLARTPEILVVQIAPSAGHGCDHPHDRQLAGSHGRSFRRTSRSGSTGSPRMTARASTLDHRAVRFPSVFPRLPGSPWRRAIRRVGG